MPLIGKALAGKAPAGTNLDGMDPAGMDLAGMDLAGTRRRLTRRSLLGAGLAAPLVARYAHAAEFAWDLPHPVPVAHPLHVRLVEAAARIATESEGRLTLTVLADGQRGNSVGLLSQVRAGTMPLCVAASRALGQSLIVAALPSLGFAWPAAGTLWTALDGELGATIRSQVELKLGLVTMERGWDQGFRHVIARDRPVRNPDELAGLRLHVPPDSDGIAMWRLLGAATSLAAPVELTRSLLARRIDAIDGPLPTFRAGRIDEVLKTCSLTMHVWDGYWICAHSRTWRSLPPGLQTLVARALDDAALRQRQDIAADQRAAHDALAADGVAFTAVDTKAYREALRRGAYYAAWRGRVADEAWPVLERYAGRLA